MITKLEYLDLHGNSIGNTGLDFIAKSKSLSGLKFLGLAQNKIDMNGLRYLSGPDRLPCLQMLDLRSNRLNGDVFAALDFSDLRYLDISNNRLDLTLLTKTNMFPNIQYLNLSRSNIKQWEVESIFSTGIFSSIKYLDLSANFMTISDADEIESLNLIKWLPNLRHLNLCQNWINKSAAETLISKLKARGVNIYIEDEDLSTWREVISTRWKLGDWP